MALQTITVYPSSHVQTAAANWNNMTNGYTSSTSTYAQIDLTTGAEAVTDFYYKFDLSEIPEDATIMSISCLPYATMSTADTSYISSYSLYLQSGSTQKGESGVLSSWNKSMTLDVGSWTRSELNDCRLRFYVTRGSSGTSDTQYIRFYTAKLTILYKSEATSLNGSVAIQGVPKTITEAYTVIQGISRKLIEGYINNNGVLYPIWGGSSSNFYLKDIPVGTVVYLNMDGTPREFIVIDQKVSTYSDHYDSTCLGTWLLMKEPYTTLTMNNGSSWVDYSQCYMHKTYLNNTLLNKFDSDIQGVISQAKIPYATFDSSTSSMVNHTGSDGVSAKLFLPSHIEITAGSSYYYPEGGTTEYFKYASNNNRCKTESGFWIRSAYFASNVTSPEYAFIKADGTSATRASYNSRTSGVRPALIIPFGNAYVDENMNVCV